MVTTDPIADLLTTIRNALMINRSQISVPYSGLKLRILEQLVKTNYIESVEVDDSQDYKSLKIVLFRQGDNPRINSLTRISSPGRRVYSKADKLPIVKSGRGLVLVSTSKGVMTGQQASKQRLGGEVICKIY